MSAPACPLLRRRVLMMLGPALGAAAMAAAAEGARPAGLWKCGADQCAGYSYDPALGERSQRVAPGTAWEDVPEDFFCPRCGAGKSEFFPLG
jgi:rubredoxin